MNIKVKYHILTTASILNSGLVFKDPCVCFIAYSQRMKASVLEAMILSPGLVKIDKYDGPAKDGEWLEEWDG